jgi:hypothetical protein
MPRCFSRPICRLTMRLNDMAGNRERQQLLPFVTRLACADTPEIEQAREDYIESRMPKFGLLSIEKGIEILEGALAIGRQADPLAPDAVGARLEATKGEAKARSEAKALKASTKPNRSLPAKLKAWFTTKALEAAD